MNTVTMANLAGVCLALSAAVGLAGVGTSTPAAQRSASYTAAVDVVERDGRRGLLDASGHFFALRSFQRVVSLSLGADDLLLALSEPERVAAYSAYAPSSAAGYRFGPRRMKRASPTFEELAAHQPDLVLAHSLSLDPELRASRDAGMPVFDLGSQRGMATLLPNIRTVATLLGRPEAGVELASSLEARMHALAARIPARKQKRGLYVGVHGDKLYGGTTDTSYADVLRAAGLTDIAAAEYRGWPRYTAEQLLRLDPDVIVTQVGMRSILCAQPGMEVLRACHGDQSIVEMPGEWLVDPGLDLPQTAEMLQRRLYPNGP